MKCDVCQAEATVFLTQIINGQMTTVNLCEVCSKEKGVTNEAGFGLAEAFVGQAARAAENQPDIACPACGFTAAQFRKIGRMGCPECYSSFQDGLDSMLRGMHKGTRHVGKRPGALPAPLPTPPRRAAAQSKVPIPPHVAKQIAEVVAKIDQQAPTPSPATVVQETPPPLPVPDLKKLRAELDLAVKEERYEDAGVIKLKIDEITKAGGQ